MNLETITSYVVLVLMIKGNIVDVKGKGLKGLGKRKKQRNSSKEIQPQCMTVHYVNIQ